MNPGPPNSPDTSRLLNSVNDAARHLGIVAPFVLTCAYVLIAAGSVTHETLLRGHRLKLPLLLTEVSLEEFFLVAPLLLVLLHAFLLFQQWVLKERIQAAWEDLGDIKEDLRWRYVYPSLPVLRSTDREEARAVTRFARLFYFLAMTAPLAVLLFMQRTIAPLHDRPLILLHQFLVLVEVVLILGFWPSRPTGLGGEKKRWINPGFWIGILISLPALAFSFLVAIPPDGLCRWPYAQTPLLHYLEKPIVGLQGRVAPTTLQLSGFRLQNSDSGLVLEGRSLRCADLRGAELPGVVLRGADLRGVDLSGADLSRADLSPRQARELRLLQRTGGRSRELLSGVDARSTQADVTLLAHAKLDGAVLTGASMTLVDASWISARKAEFALAQMTRINLTGADLFDADLRGAEVSSSILDQAQFDFAKLLAANFFNTTAHGTDFVAADARLAVFDGSDLKTALFHGTDLRGSSFREARHYGSFFPMAQLQGTRGLILDMVMMPAATIDRSLACSPTIPVVSYLRGATISDVDRRELARELGEGLDAFAASYSLAEGKEPRQIREARSRLEELDESPAAGRSESAPDAALENCAVPSRPDPADELQTFTRISKRLLEGAMKSPGVLCTVLRYGNQDHPTDPIFQEVLRTEALHESSPLDAEMKRHLRQRTRGRISFADHPAWGPCDL